MFEVSFSQASRLNSFFFLVSALLSLVPGGSDGKASVYNAGDPGSIPGSGRFPGEGNGNPLQYYYLENPMDRGAWSGRSAGEGNGNPLQYYCLENPMDRGAW